MFSSGKKKIFGLVLLFLSLIAGGGFFYSAYAATGALDLTLTVTSGVTVCGNGILEPAGGEQCDNGSSNGSCPATCSASCQTNSCPPNPPDLLIISDLAVADITANGANISWKTNRIALCSLRYGLDTNYASSTITESTYLATHSVALSGLSTSTTYHYRINCSDSFGVGAFTNDDIFTTLAETPPLTISNLNAANITENSADIGWDTNRSAICRLRWGLNADYGDGSVSEIAYLSSHLSPLSGLTPDTLYHYAVDCRDASGHFAVSDDQTFRTLLGPDTTPPGNVIGLRATSGNTTSTLFWRNPPDPDYSGVVIRRSTSGYPGLTQGTMVYDGMGSPIGIEYSFPDSGLTNDILYYYTVFAYDTSRNYASGVGVTARPTAVPPPTCETDPSLCPPTCETDPSLCLPTCATHPELCPPGVGDLFFTDFIFFQQGRLLPIVDGNRVIAQTGYPIEVVLPQAKVLPNTDKMVLNIGIAGEIRTYLFAYDAGRNGYATTIAPIGEIGVYHVSIIVSDAADRTLKVVSGFIEIQAPTVEVLPSLPAIIDALRESPLAKAARTPIGQAAAAASVVASFAVTALSIPLINWWFLLQFLFTQPLRLLGFRKGWGTVYNAITKQPVDLALVRLYDAKTDRPVASRVTDRNGRYMFLANPGEYYIKVEKAGFDFPSALLNRTRDDGNFLGLYYGEKISLGGNERSAIIANIPLDQQDAKLTDGEILKKFSRARLSRALSWLGPVLAFGYLFFAPSIFSLALVAIHLSLIILFRRLAGLRRGKHWGVVFAPDGRHPVKQAITRIFSSQYGRMLEFYVTDNRGRYNFLVGNNKYYVTADKTGYGTAKTPIIDLTGKKPEELAIAQDLVLSRLGEAEKAAAALELEKAVDETPAPEAEVESIAAPEAKAEIAVEKPATEETVGEVAEIKKPTPGSESEVAKPDVATPAGVGMDLGSIDEIREQMEAESQAAPTVAAEPAAEVENIENQVEETDETEAKPDILPDEPEKPNEGIYG